MTAKEMTTITERILGNKLPRRRDFRRRIYTRDGWTCRTCGRHDSSLTPARVTIRGAECVFEYLMTGGRSESVRVPVPPPEGEQRERLRKFLRSREGMSRR